MEAIRKMEPAWERVCKSKFRLTSRIIEQPNGGTREVPCYQLTKTFNMTASTQKSLLCTRCHFVIVTFLYLIKFYEKNIFLPK
jgi:hypothetical protein